VRVAAFRICALNGKKAGAVFFGVRTSKIAYGLQSEPVGRTAIYVCPQTSAANGHRSPDSWHDLARDLRVALKTSKG
jgi:hypothetical protein